MKVELKLIGSSLPGNEDLMYLDQFRSEIYEKAFSGDEIEPFTEEIVPRIGCCKDSIQTYAVLALYRTRTVGGLIVDWYPECSSLEIIYLAVAQECRREGYGSLLLKDGMQLICSEIRRNAKKINCVYFESENPFSEENEANISRLRFFAHNGAMRVPIHYVQPPLSENQGFACNLNLFCLPELSEMVSPQGGLPHKQLKDFLRAFYQGLEDRCMDRERFSSELKSMEKEIDFAMDENDEIPLDRLFENPYYEIQTVSVVSHFRYLPDSTEGCPAFDNKKECPLFFSYQKDLMDYSHQDDRIPFGTHHHLLCENISLKQPPAYCFISEGESHLRLTLPDRLELCVDISLNWSYSAAPGCGYMIHVAICPSKSVEGAHFTELDLIRMITAFGSRQEQYGFIDRNGRSSVSTWEGYSVCELDSTGNVTEIGLRDWIARKMGGTSENYAALCTGITELDIFGLYKKEGLTKIFRETKDMSSFDALKGQIPSKTLWNKTMCGIALGIFDFERMNTAEIYDTLRLYVERPQSFVLFSRGHLFKIKGVTPGEDYERVENILVSPYLLIPSCALAFNELLLNYCRAKLENIRENERAFRKKSWWDRKYYDQSRKLLKVYDEVERYLSDFYLQDFFQYESERQIFGILSEQRGLAALRRLLDEQLEMIRNDADQHIQDYNRGTEMDQNMILLVLAILQVLTAIMHDKEWWILTSVSLALVAIFYISGRLVLRKNRRN